jgi:Tfp pilus assembly protein PilV
MQRSKRLPLTHRQRGVTLLDGLIALAILAFGMLAMTRFQGRLLTQASEAQSRILATQLSDELLGMALVDSVNASCYTVPPAGACASATARASTLRWAARATAELPGVPTVRSTLDLATGQLRVVLTWVGKATTDARRLEAVTDVRP